ncbi:MAG: PEP-CTERM sorting domain-containing protein [Verrucomicrobiaceae bacterium]
MTGTEPISAGDFYDFGDQGLSTESGGFGSLAIGSGGGQLTFSLPSGVSFEGLKIAGTAGSIRGPKFSFGSSGGAWDSNLQEVQRGLVGDTAYHDGAITNYSPFVALGNVALLNSFTLDVSRQTQTNPVGFAFSTVTTEAVPEPSSALLGALGILLGFRRRR